MDVYNVHERLLAARGSEVGELIDSLSGGMADRLWPRANWPAMEFDRPLEVGAAGGHGPVRYTVTAYVPATWVRFTFSGPRGFHGFHEFAVLPVDEERTVLRHTLAMRTSGLARLTWPAAYRPMHDACLEDSLDCAELACTGTVARPARRTPYVRLLRSLAHPVRTPAGGPGRFAQAGGRPHGGRAGRPLPARYAVARPEGRPPGPGSGAAAVRDPRGAVPEPNVHSGGE